jgi:hypothetical protein
MRTHLTSRAGLWVACALTIMLAPGLARAQTTVTDFSPKCGVEGDPIYIRGAGFAQSPTVTIGGVQANVVGSTADRILCRVGAGAAVGTSTVDVDGTTASGSYEVMPAGSPVILQQSTQTATPGQTFLLVGLRFGAQATVTIGGQPANAIGRWRALAVTVPQSLGAGTVDVVVTNAQGQSNAACPGSLTIAPAGGTPAITGVDPAGAAPGSRITFQGSYLAPAGLMRTTWDDGAGTVLNARALSNGFDEVYSYVPAGATAGVWTVTLATLPTTASTSYTVGTQPAPVISGLRPDTGPAGSRFGIVGQNLLAWGSRPTIDFDGQAVPVLGFFRDPSGNDVLLTEVPGSAANGAHPVTVTLGGQTSNAETFTVGQAQLSVQTMVPTSPPPFGVVPVQLFGTGFGVTGNPGLSVEFDPGTGPALAGRIIWNNESVISVMPPGGRSLPLPSGSYTVTVTNTNAAAAPFMVTAGVYLVP